MKITVFTSNQPRHQAYINKLSKIAETVYAVVETNTIFPGSVADFFKKSPLMQKYFNNVINAERYLFGEVDFPRENVQVLPIRFGDLNQMTQDQLSSALNSDVYLVFGSSFIRGWLADFLVDKQAINIHMGLSPYYRGSSCNFWALMDGNPNFVGATVHRLSKGLDSGDMLFHSLPNSQTRNPFEFTMSVVDNVQNQIVSHLESGYLQSIEPVPQDKSLQIRYTRNEDFKDEVVQEFFDLSMDIQRIKELMSSGSKPKLLEPDVGLFP